MAILTFALTISPSVASAGTSHTFEKTFGAGSSSPANPYPLLNPTDVAVDNSTGPSSGDVYVADPKGHRVEKFSSSGAFILMFGKEVNRTKVNEGAPEAQQDVCTAASGDTCQPGTSGTSPGSFDGAYYAHFERNPESTILERLFLAVDPTNGDVYVADPGREIPGGVYMATVSKFDESGKLITSWSNDGQLRPHEERNCCGGFEFPYDLGGVAVDETGVLFVVYSNHTSKYEPNGKFIEEFGGGWERRTGVGLDAEDNVYSGRFKESNKGISLPSPVDVPTWSEGLAIDPSSNDPYVVQPEEGGFVSHFAFSCTESCTPLDEFGKGLLNEPRGIALDLSTDDAYVANSGAGDVAVFAGVTPEARTSPASNVQDTTASLFGEIEPAGRGAVTSCYFQYGLTSTFVGGGTVPCSPPASEANPFAGPTDVSADLSGLRPGATYHFRLVATNAAGTGYSVSRKIETFQPPSVDGFSSSHLSATGAELSAKINPNGSDTHYRFEYGPTTAYGQSEPESPADIGSAKTDQLETVHLEGLHEGVTYHFRVVAENQYGTTTTYDQTFGFFPPQCPNATVREQTGSNSLPDCRAYELVSPANSGTALIFPAGATPNSGLANNPSRLAYGTFNGIVPGDGSPPNSAGDMYVATRTDEGWKNRYVGPPADEILVAGSVPWLNTDVYFHNPDTWNHGVLANPSLSTVADWNDSGSTRPPYESGLGQGSSNAPYLWNTTTGASLGRWPTNLAAVSRGEEFEGETNASANLNHFVFSSNIAFAEGGKSGDVYDNNAETGSVSVVSVKEDGKHILNAYPLKVSSDGSHILMLVDNNGLCTDASWTAPACEPGKLYMRINDAATYEIASGHKVNFVGMSADGAKVYFTTAEQLLPEDEDTSIDLYMWSGEKAEAGEQPLTLVSQADPNSPAGSGNSDSCNAVASWTAKCNVMPLGFTQYSTGLAGSGGNGVSDSYIASANGDIYFYSPEQLAGNKGTPNQVNLYVYREGEVQFVTTLSPLCGTRFGCAEGPVLRMDVSPDDSHMAFITPSQVTSYNNAGYSEMYSFTPATGEIICDSCMPSGEPPSSEVLGAQNGLFMANDGRAFFSTDDALVAQDTDQTTDVYEFADGRPQLISTGTMAAGATSGIVAILSQPGLVAVSADGTDVYFATTDALVPEDENGEALKIYDARTNGGFPVSQRIPGCAAAEECHGPSSAPPLSPPEAAGNPLGPGGNLHPASAAHRHHKRHRHHPKRQRRSGGHR